MTKESCCSELSQIRQLVRDNSNHYLYVSDSRRNDRRIVYEKLIYLYGNKLESNVKKSYSIGNITLFTNNSSWILMDNNFIVLCDKKKKYDNVTIYEYHCHAGTETFRGFLHFVFDRFIKKNCENKEPWHFYCIDMLQCDKNSPALLLRTKFNSCVTRILMQAYIESEKGFNIKERVFNIMAKQHVQLYNEKIVETYGISAIKRDPYVQFNCFKTQCHILNV